ncbi:MAG TPA: FG-GAP-like repeat-containing protein, partial [Acidobacteriota bacterium]|nr:FG-GAP-like repeat-containing protein [Acidobacteriota bacterium]
LLADPEPAAARAERVRVIARDAGRADPVVVAVEIAAPAPLLAASDFDYTTSGNGNGVVDAGETVSWTWRVANAGSGTARALVARARNASAGVTILDSTAAVGDLAPGAAAAASGAIRVSVAAPVAGPLFEVRLEDARAHAWTTPVSRAALPGAPAGVRVLGSGTDRVSLGWTSVAIPSLLGYHVVRALDDGSPLVRVTLAPVRPTPSFEDEGLALLTRYRYAVSAVDSSGNEGPRSAEIVASTTPPGVPGWPATLGASTSSNVGLGDLDGDGRPELAVGADYLYVFRHDGTEVRDGDANPVTTGIFTSLLHNVASSPALADIDLDGAPEIIAASWDDSLVAVFDAGGALLPGWPRKGAAPFWSTPAVGDVDQDGQPDVVIGSNASRLYAWRADGTEIRDGDGNPATDGVLLLPIGTVISSPSIVDLEKDGTPEIVFGTSAGRVYAMHDDGVLPGWPVAASGLFSSSPAIGDVVPGGPLEIVIASSNDSVYVFTPSGARAPGWPRFVELTPGNGRTNSPVLAPIRKHLGDPTLYVVIASMTGAVAVFGPDGTPRSEFASTAIGAATEASPAVADLDGDGSLEILLAGEDRRLHAFHHDGSAVSGFPIEIGAEARGTPAIWDLDGDGATEIALAGWDRRLHVWSYPGAFSSPGAAWPMWRHDNWRTGTVAFPILTSADPPPGPEPAPPPAPPARAYLAPNRPNPFNPTTLLGFGVPGPGPADVVLRVVDVSGRVVATLVSRRLDPGYHERRWDGRDDRGRDLGSGIYFLHARIGSATLTRKLALVR